MAFKRQFFSDDMDGFQRLIAVCQEGVECG